MNIHPYQLIAYEPLATALEAVPGACVISQAEVWDAIGDQFPRTRPFMTPGLYEEALNSFANNLSSGSYPCVIGIGGGTACDSAKFVAAHLDLPLILAPSALTVDAPFTDSVAVRREGKIHYMGPIVPTKIVIDTALIQSAPPALNRGGIGDLISIHTALHDWRIAADRQGEPYDHEIARCSAEILKTLERHAHDIQEVSEAGIILLAQLFCEEVALCYEAKSSRPEEGSEHHILYNLEYRTGKTYLHGPAVVLCAILAAHLQGNTPAYLTRLANSCGVDYMPESLGIGWDALSEALLTANEYTQQDQLPYTFLQAFPPTPQRVEAALNWLSKHGGERS
ncbi:MAG: iron-containing alcohol dehydrogenase [Fimbriimonadia bacterium]|nr:iron-containing alcohol dehydrogenase [Fimbriimonadia bacterium]